MGLRWLLLFVAGVSAVMAAPAEPRNISLLKQEIRAYVASGAYLEGITEVAEEARAWIEQRANAAPATSAGRRLAVVMDLDETLFHQADHMLAQDFGYIRGVWDEWAFKGEAPAMEPVRRVYETARELGVAVIFLTGRRERYREATERNLRRIGCADYAALICKPDEWTGTNGEFKLAQRRRLAAGGFDLIANVGDQASDFEGGGAERDFKLPNPFYLTR